MRRSRPFSFIRTLTVGFGIAPNLLTLLFSKHDPEKWEPVFRKDHAQTKSKKALAGLGSRPYRRWGLSPRPENESIFRQSGTGLPKKMLQLLNLRAF
jgi:hypothetical protein